MMGFERADDYQPLGYIRGRPLYVTTLLVLLHVATMIASCAVQAVGRQDIFLWLMLSGSSAVRHYEVWQFVTYAFIHPLGSTLDGILFVMEMFFLFSFGQEVEKYFGRRVFSLLYASLLLIPAFVFVAVSMSLGLGAARFGGSSELHFGVFLMFVVVYPNVQFFFNILAKWLAYAYLAIDSLVYLANWQYFSLLVLWVTAAVAYFGVRYAGVGGEFSILTSLRERFPKKTIPAGVKPRIKPRRTALESVSAGSSGNAAAAAGGGGGDVHDSIDPLLDKISKHGLASLTHSERAALERARASLLRKERGN